MDYQDEMRSKCDAYLEEIRNLIKMADSGEVIYRIPGEYINPDIKCYLARTLSKEGHEPYTSYLPGHSFGGGNKLLLKLKGN